MRNEKLLWTLAKAQQSKNLFFRLEHNDREPVREELVQDDKMAILFVISGCSIRIHAVENHAEEELSVLRIGTARCRSIRHRNRHFLIDKVRL